MSEVSVYKTDAEELIDLRMSIQEATLICQLLGRFNPDALGPLKGIYEELLDSGIDPGYGNVVFLTQTEPTLFMVVVDNDEEPSVE